MQLAGNQTRSNAIKRNAIKRNAIKRNATPTIGLPGTQHIAGQNASRPQTQRRHTLDPGAGSIGNGTLAMAHRAKSKANKGGTRELTLDRTLHRKSPLRRLFALRSNLGVN
jgi:hypothetical protein